MVSIKQIDANTVLFVQKKAGKEVGTWRVTVSEDGKTFASTGKGTDPQGQEFTATSIYDKQCINIHSCGCDDHFQTSQCFFIETSAVPLCPLFKSGINRLRNIFQSYGFHK
jgi:hypothetical protein